jgi:hypothetical protein
VYESDGLDVEFVTGAGETLALVTLRDADVRAMDANELMSVRSLKRSA